MAMSANAPDRSTAGPTNSGLSALHMHILQCMLRALRAMGSMIRSEETPDPGLNA